MKMAFILLLGTALLVSACIGVTSEKIAEEKQEASDSPVTEDYGSETNVPTTTTTSDDGGFEGALP